MKYSNTIELEIRGERALFADPRSRESLPVPSCEVLKGILCSVYWNPVFLWVPDSLRVMESINWISEGLTRADGERQHVYTRECLVNVRYQLRAHFIWNEQRPDLAEDRNEDKHFRIALRSLARGGRRNVYLGRSDFAGTVRSVHFGSGTGFYDDSETDLGTMYHSREYPAGQPRYFRCLMYGGIIDLRPPEYCPAPLNHRTRSESNAAAETPHRPGASDISR